MEKYRNLKQKHSVLKEAYLNLQENFDKNNQDFQSKIEEFDFKLSEANTLLKVKDEQINALKSELTNLNEEHSSLNERYKSYIKNEEAKSMSFHNGVRRIGNLSIYNYSVDSLYQMCLRSDTKEFIAFSKLFKEILTLLAECMEDNQSKILIEENVQLMSDRSYSDVDQEDGLDDLESLSILDLDLLRYIDKARNDIRHLLLCLKKDFSLKLCKKLIRSFLLYLTVEEYIFPTVNSSNTLTGNPPTNSSKTSYLIKNLSQFLKYVTNLSNTLLFINELVYLDYDDFIKDFAWKRAEKSLDLINCTIKNFAECLSHRMCFPKIYNGRFLPLTGGTNTLIQLYEYLNEVSSLNMNIAVVLSRSNDDCKLSIAEVMKHWQSRLNSGEIVEDNQPIVKAKVADHRDIRIKELESQLVKSEIDSFLSNYQRQVLVKYYKSVNDAVCSIDPQAIDDIKKSPKGDPKGGFHTVDYLISPLSVPLINRNPNELASFVTTLIKDSMELVEDKSKLMSEVTGLKIELDKEKDRREAAEESCRASIDELTKHLNIMESTIMDYEDKLSQLKTDHYTV